MSISVFSSINIDIQCMHIFLKTHIVFYPSYFPTKENSIKEYNKCEHFLSQGYISCNIKSEKEDEWTRQHDIFMSNSFLENIFHSIMKRLKWIIQSRYIILLSISESNIHCLNQWFACDKYFSWLNHLIFTEVISETWLIHSNLFLAIWINKISLIISIFWLIQI